MSDYLGFPLFLERPNRISEPRTDFLRTQETFKDFGATDWAGLAPETSLGFQAEFLRDGKDRISSVWDFIDSRLAKLHGFWMPSWQRDVVLTAPIAAVDDTIIIEDIEYATYWFPNEIVGRHLYMEWPDKSYVIRKVVNVPSSTSLHLSEPVGKASDSNLFISFLLFVRLDQDEISCAYDAAHVGTFELPFTTIPLDTFPDVPPQIEWEVTCCLPNAEPIPILVNGYQQSVGICDNHLVICPMWTEDMATDGIAAAKYSFSTNRWTLEGQSLEGSPDYAYPNTFRTCSSFSIHWGPWTAYHGYDEEGYVDWDLVTYHMRLHVYQNGTTLRTVDLWDSDDSGGTDNYLASASYSRTADIKANGLIACMAYLVREGGVSTRAWGIKVSTDFGATWKPTHLFATQGWENFASGNVRIDDNGTIWVALEDAGSYQYPNPRVYDHIVRIYKSTDAGDSWTLVTTLDLDTGSTVYVTGIFYTIKKNDGQYQYIAAWTVDAGGNRLDYWRSDDSGATWTHIYRGEFAGLNGSVDSVKHASNDQYVTFGHYHGVGYWGDNEFRRSTDWGVNYSGVAPPYQITDSYVDMDQCREKFIYTECGATFGGPTIGALVSLNSGASWQVYSIDEEY